MKYLLFSLLFLVPLTSYAQSLSQQQVAEIIATKAVEYGVDPKLALYISWEESQWNPDAIGDHGESLGIWQIHMPAHGDIRPADASNTLWSTIWAMKQLEAGNCAIWTTCPSHGG